MTNQDSKFCTNCGEKLDADKVFCTSCGEALEESSFEGADDEQSTVTAPISEAISIGQNVEKEKVPTIKALAAAFSGVLAALLVAIGVGFVMPDSSLGRVVTSIFAAEYVPEVVTFEPHQEEVTEEVAEREKEAEEEIPATNEAVEEVQEEESDFDSEEFLRGTLAEIRALGDTGDAGEIGILASLFNETDGQAWSAIRDAGLGILDELSLIEDRLLEYSDYLPVSQQDRQLRLIELCRIRVEAIKDAVVESPDSAAWRQHLDRGRDARVEYERIIEAGGLY